jgi:GDP-4-dehydro-6-deoxy-D-mannose reductase
VRDVVRAYRLIMAAGHHGECFNVCTGRAVSLGEILEMLQAIAGTAFPTRVDGNLQRASDVPVNVGSPARLEARAGWRREYRLAATLADVLADWRARVIRDESPLR